MRTSGRHRRRFDEPAGRGAARHGPQGPGQRHERRPVRRASALARHSRGHRPRGGQPRRVRLCHPHRRHPRRQPRNFRRGDARHPRFRARAGLGHYHEGLQKRPLHLRHARQNDDHQHGDAYLHGSAEGPDRHDRRHVTAAPFRLPRRQGRHDHRRELRILQLVSELLPHRRGHFERGG